MRVAVLLVDAPALCDDLFNLGAAQRGGFFVGGGGGLATTADEVFGCGMLGEARGEGVLREDGGCWRGMCQSVTGM